MADILRKTTDDKFFRRQTTISAKLLTLSPLLTTVMSYVNSLDLDETLRKLGVSPGSKLFDIQTTFSPSLSNIEAL